MEKTELVQYLTCPITNLIFKNPVLLDQDNVVYEKQAIENWLKTNLISPVTKNLIPKSYNLIRLPNYEKLIDSLLNNNTELVAKQYKMVKKYHGNEKEFVEIINNKCYDDIKTFYGFEINSIIRNCPQALFLSLEITEYILKNSSSINIYCWSSEFFELCNSKLEHEQYKALFQKYLDLSNNTCF